MAAKKPHKITTGFPILTALILLVSAVSYFSPEIASAFIFDRNAVLHGEIWRLLSSHFVHFNATHLVYNLLAFGAAGWILERKNHLHYALLVAFMALAISSSLCILQPGMLYYGGLSGLACGSILYCALLGIEESGPWRTISKLIICFLAIKISLEAYSSTSILPYWGQQDFVTMPISHMTGIAAAFLFYVAVKNKNRYPNIYKAFVGQEAENIPRKKQVISPQQDLSLIKR
jgi:rhomboid family GlyGly-CTERM serine protease